MSDRHDFLTWCEKNEEQFLEAVGLPAADEPAPYQIPPSQFMRGAKDWWSRLRGKGPIDWAGRQAHVDAWQRKRQAGFTAGDSDDPAVRQQKANKLTSLFRKALVQSLPGADPNTVKAVRKMAKPFAEMFTMGRPILPSPLVTPTAGGQSVMALIHVDSGIGEPTKGKNAPWSTPFTVLRDVLFPAFNSDNSVWYDPQAPADRPQDRRPPGSAPEENAWRSAVQTWQTTGTGQQRKQFTKADLEQAFTERDIKPGDLHPERLDRMMKDIIDKARAEGNFVTVDEQDMLDVKTALAADVVENTLDLMKFWFPARKFMSKQRLLHYVKYAEDAIRSLKKEPQTDWDAIIRQFLKYEPTV